MNEKEILTTLKRVPLFESLNQRQLTSLARMAYERNYKAGDTIVKQGDEGIGLFIIVTGEAKAIHKRPDTGESVEVNTFKSGDFFGELALLDTSPGFRTASVVTTSDTVALGLPRWDFQTFLKNDAEMTFHILQEVVKRFNRVLGTL